MPNTLAPNEGPLCDPQRLEDWLSWLEARNPHRIELGLDRVRAIWQSLCAQGYRSPRVVTVAGTNGKGSSVALLEAIFRAQGYRVGAYTSPHLVSFTERIRLDGVDIQAAVLIEAFEILHRQPGSEALTYFEWATLAAFIAFSRADLEVWVLEVGLGGRLDAVNVLDADMVLITSIGLDHQAILGQDRAAIGIEKAGVMRAGQPAVYMDAQPEHSVLSVGQSLGADLWVSGRAFSLEIGQNMWHLHIGGQSTRWPWPSLTGSHQIRNAAGVVALLLHPGNPLEVSRRAIEHGLTQATVIGRFERWLIAGKTVLLDVAHNEESLDALLENIHENSVLSYGSRRLAVFSAFADKPIEAMIEQAIPYFDTWYVAALDSPRTADPARLTRALAQAGGQGQFHEKGIVSAYNLALAESAVGDQIVIFGSFLTISCIRPELSRAGAHLV